MIVYDKEQKQIVIPNGLGNVNIVINQGGECNLGIGDYYFDVSDLGTYELYAENDGYDGWSKMFVHLDGGAIKVWRAANLLVNEYPDYGTKKYVGGEITEIQEVIEDCYKTYVLDNRLKIYRGGWFDGICFDDYSKPIKVGDYVIVYGVLQDNNGELIIEEGSQVVAYQECAGGEGGSCNLEDKWVTPSMNDRDSNGFIVVSPSEGYDGLSLTVIDPQTIYNEGVEDGRASGGGCTLTTRTIKENGTYHPNDAYLIPVINLSQNGAFDSKLKVDVINTYIEFYFVFKDERPGLISFYGCEDADWNDSTFAARYYEGNINVKIGTFERSFNVEEYGLTDGAVHKMKVGRTYGISIDDRPLVTQNEISNGIVFTPSETRTLYIGAINSPGIEDNGLNLFWRPFNGFIGPVAIYGKREDGEQVLYNYEPGDYGWWGDYKIVETDQRVENINREPDATPLDHKWRYPNADGFSEVTVNVKGGNLGVLDWTLDSPYGSQKNASDDGYDGYSAVVVRPENIIAQEKENAINDLKNKMQEITIAENGTYSIDDQELLHSISFDGNSYFNTGIVPTENIKIEACIKITNGNDSSLGGIIIGGGIGPVDLANPNSTENRGIAIGMGGGAIYGIWGGIKSENNPYKYEGEGTTTVVLQKTGDSWGWPSEKGSFGASTLYIGGYNRNGEEVEEKFLQSIVYIKIWTNKDDDSTMTLFRPNNMAQGGFGMVNSEGTEYNYVENLGEGTATFVEEYAKKYPYGFKRVEVNVSPKINVQEAGLKFSRSTFAEVPEWADFNGITDMSYMFIYCKNLQTIPFIDTSNVTNMGYMFGACQNLQAIPLLNTSNVTNMTFMLSDCNSLQTMPLLNTSNVTDMSYMLNACYNLQTIPLIDTSNVTDMCYMFAACQNLQAIPQIDTSKVTDMHHMFEGCSKLQTIPLLNTSNVTNMNRMFGGCSNLQTIPQIDTSKVTDMNHMFNGCSNLQTLPKFNCQKTKNMSMYFSYYSDDLSSLTDVGGWENLSCNWSDSYGLASCPNLTYQSCINILNGLYDFVGNGSTETRTLRVHPNFLTTVGDEISIGRNKGWTITTE